MGKVIAMEIEDVGDGCCVTAYHITGKKRRIKWSQHFDTQDPREIKLAVEALEPRKATLAEAQGGLT